LVFGFSMTSYAYEEISIHGHRVAYQQAGDGPVLLLIHGITSSAESWREVLPALAEDHRVIAPDLLGHGRSAKPRGDYSLGAYASGIRDLLLALGHDRATVVGHSLGGGVAMQFSYQFPERTERLALVSSGGLGEEVHVLLRAATLPGSEFVLPLLASRPLLDAGEWVSRTLGRVGLRVGSDVAEMARGYASLGDRDARAAFVHSLRSIVDPSGQRVSAMDRLYLASELPSLIVWGERDPILPVAHGRQAHDEIPHSRLEIIPDAGHFPMLDDPRRFTRILTDFIAETDPAWVEADDMRSRVLEGP
jgi:pimeloyl-ACP methyl ester carboxylesterase